MPMTTSQMFPNGADIWSATASAANEALRFVKQTTTQEENYKVAPAGAGEDILGIAIAEAGIGEAVGVCTSSIGALEVDGSGTPIVAGSKLMSAADGIGVVAGLSSIYGAVALEPATSANAIIRVLVRYGVTAAT